MFVISDVNTVVLWQVLVVCILTSVNADHQTSISDVARDSTDTPCKGVTPCTHTIRRTKRLVTHETGHATDNIQSPLAVIDDGIFDDFMSEQPNRQWSAQEDQREKQRVHLERQRAKDERVKSIKEEILDKLGMDKIPDVQPCNRTELREQVARLSSMYRPLADDPSHERILYKDEEDTKTIHVIPMSCNTSFLSTTDIGKNQVSGYNLLVADLTQDYRLQKRRRPQVLTSSLNLYKVRQECLIKMGRLNTKRICNKRCRRRMARLTKRCHMPSDVYHVTAYRYLRPTSVNMKDKLTIVSTVVVQAAYTGWIKLDLQSAVLQWLTKPRKNYGLALTVQDEQGKLLDPTNIFIWKNCHATVPNTTATGLAHGSNSPSRASFETDELLPTLELVTHRLPANFSQDGRLRRNTVVTTSFWSRSHCSVEKFYVSVAELGWENWIVQPLGFEYAVCRGTCVRSPKPNFFPRKVAPHNKTIFKPVKHGCCGPTKVRPLVVIHFDSNRNLTISKFDDFLISECGCYI